MFVVINVTLKEVSKKCSITFDFIAPCSSFSISSGSSKAAVVLVCGGGGGGRWWWWWWWW